MTGTGAGAVKGGQAYVYVPVAIDPATGAYTVLPGVQTQTAVPNGTEQLPQQEVKDYSTLTPEQILIPEEQNREWMCWRIRRQACCSRLRKKHPLGSLLVRLCRRVTGTPHEECIMFIRCSCKRLGRAFIT